VKSAVFLYDENRSIHFQTYARASDRRQSMFKFRLSYKVGSKFSICALDINGYLLGTDVGLVAFDKQGHKTIAEAANGYLVGEIRIN
jgi:hypothetical protein